MQKRDLLHIYPWNCLAWAFWAFSLQLPLPRGKDKRAKSQMWFLKKARGVLLKQPCFKGISLADQVLRECFRFRGQKLLTRKTYQKRIEKHPKNTPKNECFHQSLPQIFCVFSAVKTANATEKRPPINSARKFITCQCDRARNLSSTPLTTRGQQYPISWHIDLSTHMLFHVARIAIACCQKSFVCFACKCGKRSLKKCL